ncbi:MAG TPA: hypothetical protein ENI66_00415 [Candidatus Yonathbacteria bacterium]|nr:hypothetical protein [Candidatus Yonathbacteria bacterium]
MRGELKEKEQPKTKNPNEGESTRQPSGTNNSFRYSEKNSSDSFESVIDLDSGDFVDEKPKSHAKYPNARTIFALFDHPEPGWKINTTELKSAELLYLKGIKNVMGALRFFKDYRDEEMCPQIYKPSDLERKWKNLVHFRAKLGV